MILLAEVRASGGELRLRGADLVASRVPSALLAQVKAKKPEIVQALRSEAMGGWDWTSHPWFVLLDEIADVVSHLPDSALAETKKSAIVIALRDFHNAAYDRPYFNDGIPLIADAMAAVAGVAKSVAEPALEGKALVGKLRDVFGVPAGGAVDASAFA